MQRMLIIAGAGMLLSALANGQELQGDWYGKVKTPQVDLRIAVHFAKDAAGKWSGSLDSLDQGANGIPMTSASLQDGTVKFEIAAIRGSFTGTFSNGGKDLTGTWNQAGTDMPMTLTKGTPPAAKAVAPSDIDGDWEGTLDVGTAKLRLIFHIRNTDQGIAGTLDSIDQGAKGIPISAVNRDGNKVKMEIKAVNGGYQGTLDADKKNMTGEWSQGTPLPLSLKRVATGAKAAELRRPQNPVKPYPYREAEVSYENRSANLTLAGTLTLPQGKGPFPVALLITGSGPQDRDESLLGHKPFLVLADHLSRQGIAVLRVDDRGVGKSTGKFDTATSADFATDVEAGIAYLKTRPELNPRQIGLIGHSEGGMIAPMVASRNSDVAWMVLMAGTGMTGEAILTAQQKLIAQAMGAKPEQIEKNYKLNQELYALLRQTPDPAEFQSKVKDRLTQEAAGNPAAAGAMEAQLKMLGSPWFRYFLDYDPAPALTKVKVPVLAINGERDLQVPAKDNLAHIRKALIAGGNKDIEVVELPNLNHLFQTAKTGSPTEYATIEETISPTALNLISTWIKKHT